MTTSQRASAKAVFDSPDELLGAVGRDLGVTEWAAVDETGVRNFLKATGSPAHSNGTVPPLMILSWTNRFLPDLLEVRGVSSGVNYGAGTVRFPAAVHEGQRIRASARLSDASEVPGGVQTTVEITVEAEGSTEAVCVVESLSRWMR